MCKKFAKHPAVERLKEMQAGRRALFAHCCLWAQQECRAAWLSLQGDAEGAQCAESRQQLQSRQALAAWIPGCLDFQGNVQERSVGRRQFVFV